MSFFKFLFIPFFLLGLAAGAQDLYFPPASGSWSTMPPSEQGWCQPRIDSLYAYLGAKNTKSFIILVDGRIVLEKYFGTYTQDSIFYWASASKSLASFMTGIAKQKGLLNLNDQVSQYLNPGWTSAPLQKENLILVKDLLCMTSGLDDAPPLPCVNEDTMKTCLLYKVDAGTRWAYHTGAYKKVQEVVSAAAGLNYNLLTTQWIKQKTGMGGLWINQTYYSTARDMARFGLLNLARGRWAVDTVMKDSVYFKAMSQSSQTFNPSYGYLWWLNGKTFFLNPGLQLPLPGPIIPNAPQDLYAALGKNDQKIYIVPSTRMVVVRQGNSAENVTFALSNFDNKLWAYISQLKCNDTGIETWQPARVLSIFPVPAGDWLQVQGPDPVNSVEVCALDGSRFNLNVQGDKQVCVTDLAPGLYQVTRVNDRPVSGLRFVKQ